MQYLKKSKLVQKKKKPLINTVWKFSIQTGSDPAFEQLCLTHLTLILALIPIKLYLKKRRVGFGAWFVH